MNKLCKTCNQIKDYTEFSKSTRSKDGFYVRCKVCNAAKTKKWRSENREKHRAYCKQWALDNLDKVRIMREKHLPKARERSVVWRLNNKGVKLADVAARKKHIKIATPKWADLTKIKNLYVKAEELSKDTGIKHSIDHIVPLRGKFVCGLHVENNLQVIPLADNLAKRNNFDESVLDKNS